MAHVLHLFAHPHPSDSRVNARLWHAARTVEGITAVDLYARYPRFDINPDRERDQLSVHDVLVLQFPLYWYAAPALVKEWCDTVLTDGWAYGRGGTALVGKTLLLALTTGSPAQAYRPDGFQRHPIETFLTPYRQLATLCGMAWLPPYVLHGAANADQQAHAEGFTRLLSALRDDRIDRAQAAGMTTMDSTRLPLIGDGQ